MTNCSRQRTSAAQAACPGPIPTSPEHAERCRACGKCGALARLLNARPAEGTLRRTATTLSTARLARLSTRQGLREESDDAGRERKTNST